MDQKQLIEALLPICQRASDAILEVYQRDDLSVETKQDSSPVTAADLAAHQIILQGLTDLTPDIPQLSEESVIPNSERLSWNRFWCIDPLDGTKEFIQRNGEFTINIALIENNRPILGIIFIPVSGTAYWGGIDTGAWKKLPEHPPAQIRSRPLSEELVIASSRRHGQDKNARLLKPIQHQFRHIKNKGMGSSLKMCLIAEGVADFYPRLFPTSEWDTAAAQAIVEAAGGRLVDARSLAPLTYNQRQSLENPSFYVCGDPQFPLEEIQLRN
ncbi:3'(2'),5'-bisphosphate nucleotidase CysQ [uncultured Neptuniibacter sp.]|uniref:3'(2'),5'-bisphosphate nucleotidase CysQ n=1 Tax=uncultured Neptuniibacter sp. TaxID=502143 RepID=UPI00260A3343|nr:3'(2'),5'-bisphosphate nucleotidase CysQ [uncultured Neptuniibacter sp.]